MKPSHTIALLVALLTCWLTSDASAQARFLSQEGLPTARSTALDSLGSDARLVSIGSLGFNIFTGAEAFNIETGEADIWAYVFYSPSRNASMSVGVIELVPGIYMASGSVEDSADGIAVAPQIATDRPYSTSDQMALAIRSNSAYQAFRQQNGSVRTGLILLQWIVGAFPGAPPQFPHDDEMWIVTFSDETDTTQQMVCAVLAASGETVCLTNEALAAPDESVSTAITMSVAPNPSSGRTRVTITAPGTDRSLAGVRIGLFDATGREVLDLTASFASSGYAHAGFDASSLAPGTYFCRAVGSGFNDVVGTVVVAR